MYKYIALTALALGSAALGFNINRGDDEYFSFTHIEPTAEGTSYQNKILWLDLNQDGLDDKFDIRSYGAECRITVQIGLGDGIFSEPAQQIISDLPSGGWKGGALHYVQVCNINSDQYPDVAFGWTDDYDFGSYSHDVFLSNNGSGGFTCAGDVTGDGTTDVNDLLGVIGDWGCTDQGLPD